MTRPESAVVRLYDKLVAALNPFFRHYSSHRLVGFLVFVCIILGVAVLAMLNAQCVDTKSTELRVDEKYGNFLQQKAFVETLMSDLADSQGQDVKKNVDICTFGAWATVPGLAIPIVPGYTNPAMPVAELQHKACIYPRDKDIKRMGFPDAMKWCTKDELTEPVRKTYYTGSTIITDALQKQQNNECKDDACRSSDGSGGFDCWAGSGDPFACAGGRVPVISSQVSWDVTSGENYRKYTCCKSQMGSESKQKMGEDESVAPQSAWNAYYDLLYPGWRCILDNDFDDKKCPACSYNPRVTAHGTYVNDCSAYLYCGVSVNRHVPDQATRWHHYDQSPWGTMIPYTQGYQIRTTTKSCPKKDFGTVIGSALAYVTYIELLATLVIGGLFIALGISKPNTKQASFMNLLRGAGISEMDKNQDQVDELEKKVNAIMAQSGVSNASAPSAHEVGVMMPSVQPPPQPQLVQPPLQQIVQPPPQPQLVQPPLQQPLQQPVVTVSNAVEPPQQLAQAAFCTGCGAPLKPGAKFCTTCGKSGP